MLKKVISDESGRILVWTLVILGIGALLIPTLLTHASTNLLATRATEEGLKEQYAADAGVEKALWHLQRGELEVPQFAINNKTVDVTIDDIEDEGEGIYKITSTATTPGESSTTIVSYVGSASISRSMFGHAVAALGNDDEECDIDFGGNAEITSDVELGGDIYANGNVCVSGNAEVDGDATATENITTTGNADILGEQTEGAPPLAAPEIGIEGYKAEAENVECAVCGDIACDDIVCGDITRWGDWSPFSGDYEDPEHVQGNLNISGIGTFTFGDTVCVDQNLNISSITTVTFEGPVKVVGNLNISTLNTVTFKDIVCVEGNLVSSSEVVFEGGVKVGGKLDISGNEEVTFEGPVKVEGELEVSGNAEAIFGDTIEDTVCVGQDLNIDDNAEVTFAGPVKVEGNLDISGDTATFGGAVCVTVNMNISSDVTTLQGPVKVEGEMDISSNSDVPFGDTLYVGESGLKITGNATVEFGGTAYICGYFEMTGNSSELVGGEAVIAEGDIDLRGNSDFSEAAEDIPFVVSVNGDITTLGNSSIAGILYARNGDAYLSGNSSVYGAVVAMSVTGLGNNDVFYPSGLLEARDDLPGDMVGFEIRTYNIYP